MYLRHKHLRHKHLRHKLSASFCARNGPKHHVGFRAGRKESRDVGNPLRCRGLKIWILAPYFRRDDPAPNCPALIRR